MKNLFTNKVFLACFFLILGAFVIGLGLDLQKATLIVPGISLLLIGGGFGVAVGAEFDGGKHW